MQFPTEQDFEVDPYSAAMTAVALGLREGLAHSGAMNEDEHAVLSNLSLAVADADPAVVRSIFSEGEG